MFNPSGNGASRFMSRMSRRLLDGMRSEFGDQLQGGLYFPLVVVSFCMTHMLVSQMNMKDAECAESKENQISDFYFSSYGHFCTQNMVNFR